MNSVKTNKDFYQKLGATGMAGFTSSERDLAYIKFLTKKLPKQSKVLDCACGYGRLTIPLAKKNFKVQGIDLSACMIKAAKDASKKEDLIIDFKVGNMCKLPYKDKTFAAVICMWSSFNHLLTERDQLKALREMLRVTAKDGLILIDLPNMPSKENQSGEFIDTQHRLYREKLADVENIVYMHDKKTISHLLKKLKVDTHSLKNKKIGGTSTRLIVEIRK